MTGGVQAGMVIRLGSPLNLRHSVSIEYEHFQARGVSARVLVSESGRYSPS